jgi:hypothetical protein
VSETSLVSLRSPAKTLDARQASVVVQTQAAIARWPSAMYCMIAASRGVKHRPKLARIYRLNLAPPPHAARPWLLVTMMGAALRTPADQLEDEVGALAVWTKTADEILASVARLCRRLSDSPD